MPLLSRYEDTSSLDRGRASVLSINRTQQLPRLDVEGLCQPRKVVDRQVSPRSLNVTQVATMQPGSQGELFLTHAQMRASQPKVPGQYVPQLVWM